MARSDDKFERRSAVKRTLKTPYQTEILTELLSNVLTIVDTDQNENITYCTLTNLSSKNIPLTNTIIKKIKSTSFEKYNDHQIIINKINKPITFYIKNDFINNDINIKTNSKKLPLFIFSPDAAKNVTVIFKEVNFNNTIANDILNCFSTSNTIIFDSCIDDPQFKNININTIEIKDDFNLQKKNFCELTSIEDESIKNLMYVNKSKVIANISIDPKTIPTVDEVFSYENMNIQNIDELYESKKIKPQENHQTQTNQKTQKKQEAPLNTFGQSVNVEELRRQTLQKLEAERNLKSSSSKK